MPIHERIYRRLEIGTPRRAGWAPWVISSYLAKTSLRGWFARFVFWGSFVPVFFLSAAMYITSRSEELSRLLAQFLGEPVSSLAEIRPETWYRVGANGMYWMMGHVQGWFALMIAAFVGAPQIADDLKTHAFEVYLSRPIRPVDYLLGKILVVLRPLMLITAAPCLAILLVANLLLDGSYRGCLTLYPIAVLGSLIIGLLHSIVILGISSLGKSSRYATILWFVLYFLTFIIQQILVQQTGNAVFDLVSYRANLQIVLAEVLALQPFPNMDLDVGSLDRSAFPSVAILAALAAGSIALVWRRLRAGRLP